MIKNRYPKISIIIPLYEIGERFYNDYLKYDQLDYPNYEIVVVSDVKVKLPALHNCRVRKFLTNKLKTGPAEKRDIAIKKATGKICAFIDDDAYPDPNWLKNAVVHFNHPNIAAVGGPGLTPKEDGYWEQLTGLVYSSFFCGGFARYRFVKGQTQFVDDYPAYNFLVEKNVLVKVGGYGTHFYGGENTFLCLKIVKRGYKILYDPDVVVYHHRRPLFVPYLRQIANIGKHRGYFARKYPETSLRLMYFIPTLLTIGFLLLSLASLFCYECLLIYFVVITIFIAVGSISVVRNTNVFNAFVVSIGIMLTHLVYGIYFLIGLFTNILEK